VLQLPRLLYLIAASSDGHRGYDQIAETVTQEFGKGVSGDNVRFLADKKLRPLGVLAAPDGSSPKLKRPNPLLALNFKAAVVPAGLVNTVTTIFRPFFWPVVVALGLIGFASLDVWLFFIHGIAQSIRHLLNEPIFFLVVFGLIVVSAALHECGHATGCRYGGARPGVMGVGLYLVWPAFYTDVTEAYRLSKGGRLRTDLGGVYFNALFMLGTLGVYLLTGQEILIVVILLLQFEMLHQFLPFLRLDGYYMIADLTGVPDIFARIKPVLTSFIPWRPADKRVTELKAWVRIVVTAWVLLTAAFILYAYGMLLLHLPAIAGTAWSSFLALAGQTGLAFQQARLAIGLLDGLQLVLLALPMLGLAWMLVRLVQRLIKVSWTRTRGKPMKRTATFTSIAAAAALLALAWTPPPADYRPISPSSKGTVEESFSNISSVLPPPPLRWLAPSPHPSASPSASASASAGASTSASASPSPTDQASASPSPSASPSDSASPSTSP